MTCGGIRNVGWDWVSGLGNRALLAAGMLKRQWTFCRLQSQTERATDTENTQTNRCSQEKSFDLFNKHGRLIPNSPAFLCPVHEADGVGHDVGPRDENDVNTVKRWPV